MAAKETTADFHDWHKLVRHPETCDRCATASNVRSGRRCLNVHGDMLCDGPQGHDGGCTFAPAWELARRLEDEIVWLALYAGDTTNELRETRGDRDEGWRRHSKSQEALARIAVGPRTDGTYNLSREACQEIAAEALDVES